MQFIYNLIHLTQGELLIKYWYFWIGLVVFAVVWNRWSHSKR